MDIENLKLIINTISKLEKIQKLKPDDFLQNVVNNLVDDCIENLCFMLIQENICPECGGELIDKEFTEYAGECHGVPSYMVVDIKQCLECHEQYE